MTATSPFDHPFDAVAVGQGFETAGRTITESDVVGFSALTGDRHPLHLDADWARTTRFRGRIAQGALVMSYALGLLPLHSRQIVALRAVRDTVFKHHVSIGDTIYVVGEVTGARPLRRDLGCVTVSLAVRLRSGPLACRFLLETLWAREAV
jgi:acyl dehydratase